MFVFGTRPEAIKLAPVIDETQGGRYPFDVRICNTGQHKELLDPILDVFDIRPDYNLRVMESDQDLSDITASVLKGLRHVLDDFRPDMILVHGDTTTTFAAALAGYYHKIPVGHIEAGLRTYQKYSPWPEELNRQLVSRICDLHFAPTQGNKNNLMQEGVPEERIAVTGNTVIDSLFLVLKKIDADDRLRKSILKDLSRLCGFEPEANRYILVTGHRRENIGEGFDNICRALSAVAGNNDDIKIVYPVHLNPNVRDVVTERLGKIGNITLIEPLAYRHFICLLRYSYLVLTDSGGIQEEAPSLGKPVLVMREVTERPEAVQTGTVILCGTDEKRIVLETERLLREPEAYEKMSRQHNPYGDGEARKRIAEGIESYL